MAKSNKKLAARGLRRKGGSIKDIAEKLKVSKSSVSIWCHDVELTSRQIKKLHEKMVRGGYVGRLKGAQKNKLIKEEKISKYRKLGIETIGPVTHKSLFFIGLGLYLGEGNKSGNQFQFTNSNPDIVRLAILWLEKIFQINKKDIILNVIVNQIHRNRAEVIKKYWSRVTGVRVNQFNKTVFIKSKSKKVYENLNEHFGTLTIRVKKSSDLQYKIMGLYYGIIKRISEAG